MNKQTKNAHWKLHSFGKMVTLVVPALGKWKQEDCEFKASLDYLEPPCLKKFLKKSIVTTCVF
jgi:hypothetical protein